MSLRLYGTISGCGRSAGAVIPALGSGRYSPGPNIMLPSWLKGSDPNFTINVFGGQPGALATVSRIPRSRPRRSVLSVRQRTDGTGPCPTRCYVPAGPSRCTVFPHLRTDHAVNLGPRVAQGDVQRGVAQAPVCTWQHGLGNSPTWQ